MGARTSRRALGLLLATLVWLVPSRALAQSETTEYYGLDTTGSVRVVFDAAGTVLTRVDYGPFGEQLAPAPGAPNDKYAGLFRDDETGLDYAQARHYNPRTGRFTSVDPVYAGLFEPQRWNRYAYALNSPLTLVDPEGLLAYSELVTVTAPDSWIPMSGMLAFFMGWGGGGGTAVGGTAEPGGRGGGGRTGGATPTTTQTTTTTTETAPPTTPPTPASPGAPPTTDECQQFASFMADVSAVAAGNHDGVGWNMMFYASRTPDPFGGRKSEAFRPSLTAGQGSDVYRHLFAYAGTVLAHRTGGPAVAAYEAGIDMWQLLTGKDGARGELTDDVAGVAVGGVMLVGGANRPWVTRQITRIICRKRG